MYNKSFLALLLCLFLGTVSLAQKDGCEKYSIPSIGISFCTPTGWTIEKKSTGNDIVKGRTRDGLTPNINVRSADYAGTISKFADGSIAEVLKTKPEGVSSIALDSKSDFSAGKLQGVKSVYKIDVRGYRIKSIQYFFSGRADTKIIITATLLWSDAEELEGLIDDSMKTFTVSN